MKIVLIVMLLVFAGCSTISKADSDNFKKQFDREQDRNQENNIQNR